MIINTGNRTDIPAYYSKWFYNRMKEGYVLVRNPYAPSQITRYVLNPNVVDAIVFCTKNPEPMLSEFENLSAYDTFWSVTITPYGKDLEPYVPDMGQVMRSFQKLSAMAGVWRVSWRYDPVLITEAYPVSFHICQFRTMARMLRGYTRQCVVSFLDVYEKTKRNFPKARAVTWQEQQELIHAMARIAGEHQMQIHLCCESDRLVSEHVDADGCLSKEVLERAIGCKLTVPKKKPAREACECLLGADIGAYNTCGHGCLYCYANTDRQTVIQNMQCHNPDSPLLTGTVKETDTIREAVQKSWKEKQLSIFDFLGK